MLVSSIFVLYVVRLIRLEWFERICSLLVLFVLVNRLMLCNRLCSRCRFVGVLGMVIVCGCWVLSSLVIGLENSSWFFCSNSRCFVICSTLVSRWLEMKMVCLLLVRLWSRSRIWAMSVGLRLLVGLFRISRFGFGSSAVVILRCCFMFSEYEWVGLLVWFVNLICFSILLM